MNGLSGGALACRMCAAMAEVDKWSALLIRTWPMCILTWLLDGACEQRTRKNEQGHLVTRSSPFSAVDVHFSVTLSDTGPIMSTHQHQTSVQQMHPPRCHQCNHRSSVSIPMSGTSETSSTRRRRTPKQEPHVTSWLGGALFSVPFVLVYLLVSTHFNFYCSCVPWKPLRSASLRQRSQTCKTDICSTY